MERTIIFMILLLCCFCAEAQEKTYSQLIGDAGKKTDNTGYQQNDSLRINHLELTAKKLRKENKKYELAGVLNTLTALYVHSGTFGNAVKTGSEALKLLETTNHTEVLKELYGTLSTAYMEMGLDEPAIDYGIKAINIRNKESDTSKEMRGLHNRVATLLQNAGKWEEARKYFKRGLEIAGLNSDTLAVHTLAGKVVKNLIACKQVKEAKVFAQSVGQKYPSKDTVVVMVDKMSMIGICIALNDRVGLKSHTNTLIAYNNSFNGHIPLEILYEIHETLTDYYFRTKNYREARQYLDKYIHLSEKTKDKLYLRTNYLWGFRLDSVAHNYKSAFDNYFNYDNVQEERLKETQQNRITQLQIEYDTEKKENEIIKKEKDLQLLTNESQLQKVELENYQMVITIVITFLALLVIIVIVLYFNYSEKRKNNRQLEKKQQEIQNQNDLLEILVEEKEWLLKEIHHRVKNNLQVIMSLLNSQSSFLTDEIAIDAFKIGQQRVHAISLIHQKLYVSDNLSMIPMREYIMEMTADLRHMYKLERDICFEIRVDDTELDVAQAVPVGLILNEGITNSIKHAFNNHKGVISISLSTLENGITLVEIKDNGKGIPAEFDIEHTKSLGMLLIKGLCDELTGKLTIRSDASGTLLTIKFLTEQTPEEINLSSIHI